MVFVVVLLALMLTLTTAAAIWQGRRERRRVGVGGVHRQVLTLTAAHLVFMTVEGSVVVLDFFGGSARWRSLRGSRPVAEGDLPGPPIFTLRVATTRPLGTEVVDRLTRWMDEGWPLDIRLDATGSTPLACPRRIVVVDGATSLDIRTPAEPGS